MTFPIEPTAQRVPMVDYTTDEKGALYISALERKLIAMSLNEIKYRTLLEMLTGEEWDVISTDINRGELLRVAVNATQRRMGRDFAAAQAAVEENIRTANEDSTTPSP